MFFLTFKIYSSLLFAKYINGSTSKFLIKILFR